MPLFHGLSLHARVLINYSCSHSAQLWSNLTGVPIPEDLSLSVVRHGKEVPLLLRDPSALLILILFALPLNIEKAYFSCVAQALYNLTFIQSISQLALLVPFDPKTESEEKSLSSLSSIFSCIKSCLERYSNISLDISNPNSSLYKNYSDFESKKWTIE